MKDDGHLRMPKLTLVMAGAFRTFVQRKLELFESDHGARSYRSSSNSDKFT
jgi:hypothetical protein